MDKAQQGLKPAMQFWCSAHQPVMCKRVRIVAFVRVVSTKVVQASVPGSHLTGCFPNSRRAEVSMQPVRIASMQQDERSQHRPLPTAEEAEGIWDRAEKRVHEMQATMKQKAAQSK